MSIEQCSSCKDDLDCGLYYHRKLKKYALCPVYVPRKKSS